MRLESYYQNFLFLIGSVTFLAQLCLELAAFAFFVLHVVLEC